MTPDSTQALFVYGTLRPGAGNPMAETLAAASSHIGRASFRGRLYRVSWYPCVVESDSADDRVIGDVFALHPHLADGLLDRLDLYEGAHPDAEGPAHYRREWRTVLMDSGETREAWIYLFNRPVDGLERIISGDFLAP